MFVPPSKYQLVPEDAGERRPRYPGARGDAIINLDFRLSAVQTGLTKLTQDFAECVVMNALIEWAEELGEIIWLKHSESFAIEFTNRSNIQGQLQKLSDRWRALVQSMGYRIEELKEAVDDD